MPAMQKAVVWCVAAIDELLLEIEKDLLDKVSPDAIRDLEWLELIYSGLILAGEERWVRRRFDRAEPLSREHLALHGIAHCFLMCAAERNGDFRFALSEVRALCEEDRLLVMLGRITNRLSIAEIKPAASKGSTAP